MVVHTSAWTDVDVPDIDIWSMYMDQPKDYPDNHSTCLLAAAPPKPASPPL